MWLSKFLVNFDEDYFEFIENNLKLLTKKIQAKFKEKVIKNSFIFNITDLKVQKIIYQLLPFRIFCHLFFCRKGSKTASKCLIFTRMFVDNYDISVMFEEYFVLKKKNISHLPISNLMETVKVKSISLNVYYMVGDFGKKIEEKKAEDFGNIFFDSVNNSFSIYVLYLDNFLRIYLNLVNPINELIIENYLSENGSVVKNVKNVKEKITKRVLIVLLT